MPQTLSYPGVYVEEVPSSVRTIVGVATSITAFVGAAPRGPANMPVRIASFSDYVRRFGGLSRASPMSYAVSHYFLNGGSDAIIVRVQHADADTAKLILPAGIGGALTLEADSAGDWGNRLRVSAEDSDPAFPGAFNLTIQELDAADPAKVAATETFLNLTTGIRRQALCRRDPRAGIRSGLAVGRAARGPAGRDHRAAAAGGWA